MMRVRILVWAPLILIFATTHPAGITQKYHHSRFGDNLICYLHAEWLSFIHSIPMYYEPFPYSDQLMMGATQKTIHQCPLKHKVEIHRNNLHTIDATTDYLYSIPYFPDFEIEHQKTEDNWFFFPVNWDNEEFYQHICSLIRPIKPLNLLPLPTDHITVAVHVRKGSHGIDLPLLNETHPSTSSGRTGLSNAHKLYADRAWPLKFPPPHFYINGIKKISELCNHVPMYVYIFTDHHNPSEIAHSFAQQLQGYTNIQLDCRWVGNHHMNNVLEDFFSMTTFDCIVYPLSNYSYVATRIANFKIQIWPQKHHWEGTKLYIDEMGIQFGRKFNHNT